MFKSICGYQVPLPLLGYYSFALRLYFPQLDVLVPLYVAMQGTHTVALYSGLASLKYLNKQRTADNKHSMFKRKTWFCKLFVILRGRYVLCVGLRLQDGLYVVGYHPSLAALFGWVNFHVYWIESLESSLVANAFSYTTPLSPSQNKRLEQSSHLDPVMWSYCSTH